MAWFSGLLLVLAILAFPTVLHLANEAVARTTIEGNQATLPIDPDDDPPLPVVAPGGTHHLPLTMVMDYAGVTKPVFQPADKAVITDYAPIIGVVVDQQAYAFPTWLLEDPTNHVVNLVLNDTPISVTYCNMVDCARVLTRDEKGVIPLRNGGLDRGDQMVLKLGGVRYGQSATSLPLRDHRFVRLSLKDWRALHPNTLVYEGPAKDDPTLNNRSRTW